MKDLIIMTPNLRNASTGGLIWLDKFAEYAQRVYPKTKVVDIMQLHPIIRCNRTINILYYVLLFLRKKNVFLFVDHNLHMRLLLPLLVNRISKRNKYAVICHHILCGLRLNRIGRNIESVSERFFLRNAQLIIVPSNKTRSDVLGFSVDKDKVTIVNPTCVYRGNRFFNRRPRNKILYVGNLEPRKAIDVLLKALALLGDLSFTCDIVGEHYGHDEYYAHLLDLVQTLGLSNRVFFHDHVDSKRVISYYIDANIFVMPSIHEGYGMVLLEAMSFGLPIVASDVAPINDIIKQGTNGFLFPPGDINTLAKILSDLFINTKLQNRMGRANFNRSGKFPTWDEVVAKTFEVLKPHFFDEHRN